MCELGFLEQIETIMKNSPTEGLTRYLFSATMQPGIEELVLKSVMPHDHPVLKVQIGIRNTTASCVEQSILYCGMEDGKLSTLR